jgi:hypothetical protein
MRQKQTNYSNPGIMTAEQPKKTSAQFNFLINASINFQIFQNVKTASKDIREFYFFFFYFCNLYNKA